VRLFSREPTRPTQHLSCDLGHTSSFILDAEAFNTGTIENGLELADPGQELRMVDGGLADSDAGLHGWPARLLLLSWFGLPSRFVARHAARRCTLPRIKVPWPAGNSATRCACCRPGSLGQRRRLQPQPPNRRTDGLTRMNERSLLAGLVAAMCLHVPDRTGRGTVSRRTQPIHSRRD
jgi:hypothetical protein